MFIYNSNNSNSNMKIKCYNCGYEWDYNGKSFYALCTRCRKLHKIDRDQDKIIKKD